jgi:hypothetical protein
MLEVQQRDHDAQRHAGAPGVAGNGHTPHLFTKEIQIRHGQTGVAFAGENLGYPCFDLLPGHALGQHGQRMAHVDHVVDTRAKEVVGGGAGKQHGRTPRTLPLLEIKLGVRAIRNHPESPVFMQVAGVLQGRLSRIPNPTEKDFARHKEYERVRILLLNADAANLHRVKSV